MEGCRSLADLLAVAASKLLADMLDHLPYVDGPLPARCFAVFNQIACVHMSGLLVRSHMNAGQDGLRDAGSKHCRGFLCRWKVRNVSRRGSIDHTICLSSCKFWH